MSQALFVVATLALLAFGLYVAIELIPEILRIRIYPLILAAVFAYAAFLWVRWLRGGGR